MKPTAQRKVARPRDPIAWEATLPIRPSSPAFRASVKAFYGTPLGDEELDLFRDLSGLEFPREGGYDELQITGGRRSGKSETIARVGYYEGRHGGHEVALAPGQVGVVAVISPLREQSQEILNYIRGLSRLKQERRFIEREVTDGVRFVNGVEIRVMTADAVSVSGPTIVCAIRDEHAKFPGDDAAMSDRMIEDALRPSLAPLAGAPPRRLIGITTAHVKSGVAYEADRDWFGKPDAPVLVLRGTTEQFNPNIDRAWLEKQRKRVGRHVFAREYEAKWQDAITDGWFGVEVVDKCVDRGVVKRDRSPGVGYVVAIDQAFKGDLFAVTVAHGELREKGKLPLLVVDHVAAWKPSKGKPLDVAECARDVASICREYGVTTVFADQHAFVPLQDDFAEVGLNLIERPWGTGKAPVYRTIRDAMVSGRVRLLDERELVQEFHNIQGELLRSGGERIEAARGHDDLVSSTVLALHEAGESAGWTRMVEATRHIGELARPRNHGGPRLPGVDPLSTRGGHFRTSDDGHDVVFVEGPAQSSPLDSFAARPRWGSRGGSFLGGF